MFRTPNSTVTRALRSPAFARSRAWAGAHAEDPASLRALAGLVEELEHANPPLSTVADRVTAAVRLVRSIGDRHDPEAADPAEPPRQPADTDSVSSAADADKPPTAGTAARERLVVAGLHYLATPVDLVPDFRPGGYLDDVLLLSWVFGAAAHELEPFLDEPSPQP
jgi:hypothetical protein